MLKFALLLLFVVYLAFANEATTSLPDVKIEGIDATALTKLNDALKNATTMEEKKTKFDEWEKTLPADQQSIAKTWLEKYEKEHSDKKETGGK